MPVYLTPFVQLTAVAELHSSGDALTTKAEITGLPKRGTIMKVMVMDLEKASINCDVYLSKADFTGTAGGAAFDIDDTEFNDCVGEILVDTWKAHSDNSLGVEDNVQSPYYAPEGKLWCQLITRGTPTPTVTNGYRLALAINY